MVWALGNAATQSSGLCECLGWPAKSIGVGNAARNGMWSALLAEKGFEGPPEPIAGVQGFLNAMAEPPELGRVDRRPGRHLGARAKCDQAVSLRLRDPSLSRLRAGLAARAPDDAIERVVLRGNPLLSDRTDRPDISTGAESQVSVQHAVAAALVLGQAGLDQFTDACARDPAVVDDAAQDRGGARPRDRDHRGAGRAVHGGRPTHRLSTPAARGSPANPMSDRDIEEKLRTIAGSWRPGYDVAPLIAAIWALDRSADAARVLALTVPR